MSSTSGILFRITTFGESHGPGVGVVIDGCPADLELDLDAVRLQLQRRRPGQSRLTTQRKESDEFEILSGMHQGKTLGTPLTFLVRNQDVKSNDYERWADVYRPSHADYTYQAKYGFRTPVGGGRASARETVGRVAAGAVAKQILEQELGLQTVAWVDSVGDVSSTVFQNPPENQHLVDESAVRCPDPEASKKMIALIEEVRKTGDTIGGCVGVRVDNVPPGLGEPVFEKLEAELARACLSIPACKGFECGSGFAGSRMRGSEHNDPFLPAKESEILRTKSNFSGGIQGGISNGMPVELRLAFKPTATIHREQETVNERGEAVVLKAGGRHDPCVLPRAVPVVEAMVNLTLVDMFLRQRALHPGRIAEHKRKGGHT